MRAATRSRRSDGAVALEPEARRERERSHEELPEISVMASGCLALVSFPREPGRVSLERLRELYPALVPALCRHPGVGFVLVRSELDGALVLGSAGRNFLDQGRVEGEDPLAGFGPNAAAHVRRTDGFAHCADLMINSKLWPEFGEVAAFEELVGSHGGLGGTQCFPFVLHPADLSWPQEHVVGAESVHRVFRSWLSQLGQPGYDSEVDSPGSSTRNSD